MPLIYPSLQPENCISAEKTITDLTPFCAGFHLDVMDGIFVPNTGWDIEDINILRTISTKQFWVHLMVSDPFAALEQLDLQPDDMVTVHYESCSNKQLAELVALGKNKFLRMGIAIKPETPVFTLEKFITTIDHALIMSVEPGFSGQKFLEWTPKKLDQLVQYKKQHSAHCNVAVDGGINTETIKIVVEHGATYLAAGSAIFHHTDPVVGIKELID